jgi:hypothetical protein
VELVKKTWQVSGTIEADSDIDALSIAEEGEN